MCILSQQILISICIMGHVTWHMLRREFLMVKLTGWNVYVVWKKLIIGELRCSKRMLKKEVLTKVLLVPNLTRPKESPKIAYFFRKREKEKTGNDFIDCDFPFSIIRGWKNCWFTLNWLILQVSDGTAKIFNEKPKIVYWRPRNVRDSLVRARVKMGDMGDKGMRKCDESLVWGMVRGIYILY